MVSPQISFGLSWDWLTIENGATTLPGQTDATFMGMGAYAGAGIMISFDDVIIFDGSVNYTFADYIDASYDGNSGHVSANGNGWCIKTGVKIPMYKEGSEGLPPTHKRNSATRESPDG